MKRENKLLVIGLMAMLALFIFLAAGCGEQQSLIQPAPQGEIPEYEIINYEDISVARAQRYILAICVPGQPTVEDMKLIAQKAAYDFAQDAAYNSLTMFFYDYKEYYGHGYSLGAVTYAPEGDIAKAVDIEAGEYDKMSFNYEELWEKDWSKQLTPEEVEIWEALANKFKEVGEGEAELIIAEQYQMTPEEVVNIYMKFPTWAYYSNKK